MSQKINNKNSWKVLVVDDNPLLNDMIKTLLNGMLFMKKDISVLTAPSIKEAQEVLSSIRDISVILIDIMVDGEKLGLEFIKFIREDLQNYKTRIILLTGYPDSIPEKKIIQYLLQK